RGGAAGRVRAADTGLDDCPSTGKSVRHAGTAIARRIRVARLRHPPDRATATLARALALDQHAHPGVLDSCDRGAAERLATPACPPDVAEDGAGPPTGGLTSGYSARRAINGSTRAARAAGT